MKLNIRFRQKMNSCSSGYYALNYFVIFMIEKRSDSNPYILESFFSFSLGLTIIILREELELC